MVEQAWIEKTFMVCPSCRRAHLRSSRQTPAGIREGEGWLLYGLVRSLRPANVVEIGRGRGAATLCLARAVADNGCGALHSIDVVPADEALTWALTDECLASVVTLHTFDSHGPEAAELAAGLEVGLLFVDGGHDWDSVVGDGRLWLPRVALQGFAIFHDATRRGVPRLEVACAIAFGTGPDPTALIELADFRRLELRDGMGFDVGGPDDNGLCLMQRAVVTWGAL